MRERERERERDREGVGVERDSFCPPSKRETNMRALKTEKYQPKEGGKKGEKRI